MVNPVIPLRCFVTFVLLLAGTPQASAGSGCGLDILGICKLAKTLAPVIDRLPGNVAIAANKVADNLFNNLLPPAVDKVTAAAESIADKAEQDYEKGLNATSNAIYDLAKKALTLTEQLAKNVTKDVEEVVREVNIAISADIDQLFKDIDQTIFGFLHELESDGQQLFCAAERWIITFQEQFETYFQKQDCECVQEMLAVQPGLKQDCHCTSCFHIGNLYPACGCKPWGFAFTSIYAKAKYQFLKCHLAKVIDYKNWNHDQICDQLNIIQQAALGFRCQEEVTGGSSDLLNYFTTEWTNVSYTIDLYRSNFTNAPSYKPTPAPTTPTRAPTTPTRAPTPPTPAPTTPTPEPTPAPTPPPPCPPGGFIYDPYQEKLLSCSDSYCEWTEESNQIFTQDGGSFPAWSPNGTPLDQCLDREHCHSGTSNARLSDCDHCGAIHWSYDRDGDNQFKEDGGNNCLQDDGNIAHCDGDTGLVWPYWPPKYDCTPQQSTMQVQLVQAMDTVQGMDTEESWISVS